MNKNAQLFLTELYEIDPTLKEHEAALAHLVETLLMHNPGIDPDEQFVQMLRTKLRERAAVLSEAKPSYFTLLTMPKFSYGIMGALLGILIAGPTMYYLTQAGHESLSPVTNETGTEGLFAYQVTPVTKNAFGDLSTMQAGGRGQGGGGGVSAPMPTNAAMAPATDAALPQAENKMAIIAPDQPFYQFNYVYKGSGFTMPQSDVSVLKRVRGDLNLPAFDALNNADLGILKLSAFPGLKIDSLSAYQATKDGYTVNLSLRDGSISIGQSWETWSHPEVNCTTEACYRSMRLKIGEVPGDEALVAIADAFLKSHGFNLKNTGTPYVDNGWKLSYEQSTDKSDFYIPEQMSVIYPYQLEGKEVYEEYGAKTGISVSIDVRSKKVAGVWNLFNQSYESSPYAAVTDKQQVLDYLANLEKASTDWLDPKTKIQDVTVELGDPVEGFIRMYKSDGAATEDLFVPALVFPVTKQPQGKDLYFGRTNVTVPLAKELLNQAGSRPMPLDGPVRIMQPMEDGVED